jgi:hypothetical protein
VGTQGGVAGVARGGWEGGQRLTALVGEKHEKHTTWVQRIRHIALMRGVCWMHTVLVVDQAVALKCDGQSREKNRGQRRILPLTASFSSVDAPPSSRRVEA